MNDKSRERLDKLLNLQQRAGNKEEANAAATQVCNLLAKHGFGLLDEPEKTAKATSTKKTTSTERTPPDLKGCRQTLRIPLLLVAFSMFTGNCQRCGFDHDYLKDITEVRE